MVEEPHQIPVESARIAQDGRSTYQPMLCWDCQKTFAAMKAGASCPFCHSENTIEWAGSTLNEKKSHFSSSPPPKEGG